MLETFSGSNALAALCVQLHGLTHGSASWLGNKPLGIGRSTWGPGHTSGLTFQIDRSTKINLVVQPSETKTNSFKCQQRRRMSEVVEKGPTSKVNVWGFEGKQVSSSAALHEVPGNERPITQTRPMGLPVQTAFKTARDG